MKLNKERILTVGHFTWSRAMLLQIILHDSGIECFLVSKETVLMRGYVDLRVKEKDVENALKIIKLAAFDTGRAKAKALDDMHAVRRIMIPVDFSDISFDACRFAISIGAKNKAEVKLVHVYYNPAIDVSPYADHYSYQIKLVENLREIEKSARENMLKLEHKLKAWCENENITQIRLSTKLINGETTDEIFEYSKKYKPALIVIGTQGLSHNKNNVYGRVANKVIENSSLPVLALPSGTVKGIEEIKSILYATDFDSSDYSALNKLIQMLAPFNIRIHCVHICFVEKKPWDSVMLEELREHLSNEYKEVDISFNNIISDDVVIGLETYIREHEINALALTTHKRNLLERLFAPSVSKKIFSEVGKPVLIFHSKN